jgi:hypothetical protein
MHKSATKYNETIGKWYKNKHGASKIIDTLETYHTTSELWTPVQFLLHCYYCLLLLVLFTFTRIVYFFAYYYYFPLDTFNPLFTVNRWDWQPHRKLGAKFLVLCAGSTLLLVQSKTLDEAPYKLSRAVTKLAGITFWSLTFSYWFDKPRFLTKEKLATVLIIPSSWGSQLGGYLPASSNFFWHRCRGKRRFLQGEFCTHILYFVYCFALLYFSLHLFIKNTKKLVSY